MKKLNDYDILRKRFSKPDHYLAYIDLGNDSMASGKIKSNHALIESIPSPETGYRFHDIIKVSRPTGIGFFRDEEVPIFKALQVITPSNLPTFSFEAVVPSSGDYFSLTAMFMPGDKRVSFPYLSGSSRLQWHRGYLVAPNIQEAKDILAEFIVLGPHRRVRNIRDAFNESNRIEGEINKDDVVIELKASNQQIRTIVVLFLCTITLFLIGLIKFGINTASDFIAASLSVILFICPIIYTYIRLNRDRIFFTKEGIRAVFPFGEEKFISWSEIKKIIRHKNLHYITIAGFSGVKIRMEKSIPGYWKFFRVAKHFSPPEFSDKYLSGKCNLRTSNRF
ncbi:MAG TPA: hypothetical protein VHO03_08440 [Ignavibacteriales bacterium]|nr:hypothetical protein [Ignavibacteriales bacterium]